MRNAHIWLIAGAVGALSGAATMYHLVRNDSLARYELPTGGLADADRTEAPLRNAETSAAVASIKNDKFGHDGIAASRDLRSISSTTGEPVAVATTPVDTKKPAAAEEEAAVQIIMSRVHDPSMTLSEIMQSEEMRTLSPETREKTLSKIAEMVNRGEIDINKFFPGKPGPE